jgi:hypothetical protein
MPGRPAYSAKLLPSSTYSAKPQYNATACNGSSIACRGGGQSHERRPALTPHIGLHTCATIAHRLKHSPTLHTGSTIACRGGSPGRSRPSAARCHPRLTRSAVTHPSQRIRVSTSESQSPWRHSEWCERRRWRPRRRVTKSPLLEWSARQAASGAGG